MSHPTNTDEFPASEGFPTREEFPTPREGLDNGSLSELRLDASEVELEVSLPRTLTGEHRDITVPDDASSLLEGMEAYGA